MNQSYSKGVLYCLIATASWGVMFPVMTGALVRIDPFSFTCLRYSAAGLAFLVLVLLKEGRSGIRLKGERPLLAWFFGTVAFAGFGFLVFFGQQMAGPQGALTASIMMATQPMLGLLVNWVVRKVAPPLYSFLFILLSFVGVTLVITKGELATLIDQPQSYGANGLITLGALCWVIYTVGATFFPRWSPFKYTAMTTLLGLTSVYAITVGMYCLGFLPVPSVGAVVSVVPHLLYMAFVAGFIGVLCWNLGNKILTPLNGVLFMDVVPLTAFIVSALQGIIPTGMQVVGACVSGAALILNNLYLRYRSAAPPLPAPAMAGKAS